ncbi:MAG: HPr kinase/phosphorylase [Roseovarius sp.]
MTGPETVHASTVALDGRAVLIRGASGCGKSGLALQLMAMGAALVADDRTRIWVQDGQVWADAPDAIRGRIEARGVGILQAPPTGPQPLVLVIDMDRVETARLPERRETRLIGMSLPAIDKSESAHFPAAVALYLRGERLD